jgi:hypothetical protein
MNLQKHIWEGWTVQDFIDDLEPIADMTMRNESIYEVFKHRDDIKDFCMEQQPYYKKYIPEVVNYFAKRYNLD